VGTVETPTIVKLSSFDVTGNTWGTIVKDAVNGVTKYIILDLNNCITTGNTNRIVGATDPSDNHFNIIKSDYVVGVILPNDTKEIKSAFNNWTSIRYVTLNSSLEKINTNTFIGATNLESITIPESVTTIGGGAFQTSGIKSITISESVTSIDNGAFQECDFLTRVTFNTNTLTLTDQIFDGDLHTVYNGAGTYTKTGGIGDSSTWTKN
jgi:hypothetical protein